MYLSNYVSSQPRHFLFHFFFHRRVRPQNLRFLSSGFLFRAARKIVASSRMLVAESPLPAPSSLLLDEGIPMHKYIRTKRALRAVSVPLIQFLSSPFLLPHPSRYVFRSSAFSLFVSQWFSLFSRYALSLSFSFSFTLLSPRLWLFVLFSNFRKKEAFASFFYSLDGQGVRATSFFLFAYFPFRHPPLCAVRIQTI